MIQIPNAPDTQQGAPAFDFKGIRPMGDRPSEPAAITTEDKEDKPDTTIAKVDATASSGEQIKNDDKNASQESDANKNTPPAAETNNDSAAAAQNSEPEFEVEELDAEALDDISTQVYGLTTQEVQERLQRLEELEKSGPFFKSEKQKAAYKFLSEYGGDDFEGGLVRYARLNKIDASADAKSVLKEKFIQSNPDLSIQDAETLFEDEFAHSYQGYDDPDNERSAILKVKLERDKAVALRELNEIKEKFKPADEPENSQADMATEMAQKYLERLDKEVEPISELTFSVPGLEGSEFNFKVDSFDVKDALKSEENLYRSIGWLDESNNLDLKMMASDIMILRNLDAITEQIVKHGMTLGKEAMAKEINNAKQPGAKGQEGEFTPQAKTFAERVAIGIRQAPHLNR